MNAIDTTISLEALEKQMGGNGFDAFAYELGDDSDFTISQSRREEFVTPMFSVSQTSQGKKWTEARIVLVSAVGASGKSWLSERLSYDLKSPVVNLGKMKVVASYSLTGVLYKRLGARRAGEYIEKLQSGQMGLVIDALDEGYQKTNTDGYFDFLDDVIGMLPEGDAMPIALLGRTNAVELAALHMQERGIDFAILTIEPFTIDKAKEFIDKRIKKEKNDSEVRKDAYKALRDYIIDTIGCFFKSQSDISKQRESFIGYAPVLLAISDYIKGVGNYQKELNGLKQLGNRNVSLIIDITGRILRRDKNEKVDELMLRDITSHRDKAFQDKVYETVYLPEEQCARVLYAMLGKTYTLSPIDDEDFNIKYNEKIKDWMQDHPFLNGHRPANIVFESYVLARLAMTEHYKADVYEYLQRHYSNSYIFFYIFHELHHGETIDLQLVPFLYASLNALDAKDYQHSLDLSFCGEQGDGQMELEAEFDDAAGDAGKYEYKVRASAGEELRIGAMLSNANIDVPLPVCLSAQRTELVSPIYISCTSLAVCSGEIIVNTPGGSSNTTIEADGITTHSGGSLPCIRTFGGKAGLALLCKEPLQYPYADFQASAAQPGKDGFTEEERGFYMKMRKTLIMFRSHSKGKLAKCCSKIDSRVGRKDSGRPVLEALMDKHIIYKENFMYYLDLAAMDKYLGVSFDGIKECVINNKVRDFVSNIPSGQ